MTSPPKFLVSTFEDAALMSIGTLLVERGDLPWAVAPAVPLGIAALGLYVMRFATGVRRRRGVVPAGRAVGADTQGAISPLTRR